METLILTLDTIALMVVLYFGYRRDKAPGEPDQGPFRLRIPAPEPTPAPRPGTRAIERQVKLTVERPVERPVERLGRRR